MSADRRARAKATAARVAAGTHIPVGMLHFSKRYRKELQSAIIEDRKRDSGCAILVGSASHDDLLTKTRKPSADTHQLAPTDPAVRGKQLTHS
jgi:hypothetical protein